MKRCLLPVLGLLLSFTSLQGQFYNPEASEQTKRTIRVNNHIEKKMQGQIVKHLFKGSSKHLYGFVFRSEAGEYYHVSIKAWEGAKLMPYLKTEETLELAVTGDPVLLKQVLHLTNEFLTIENKLDIRLKGLAHFESISSSAGSYHRQRNTSRFSLPNETALFHENVAIVAKKKVPENTWAYILENDDTILVKYEHDDEMKGKKKVSYFTSSSPISKGGYLKAPNTYNFISQSPHAPDQKLLNPYWVMAGRSAIILDQGSFEVLDSQPDHRGLFHGLKTNKGTLFFNAKHGEEVTEAMNGRKSFEAYYKNIGDDSLMLYVIKTGREAQFFDNNRELFSTKNNYQQEEVSFTGEITQAHFRDTPLKAKLQSFVVSDSIFVAINEIVALNIQKMVKAGKKVVISGRMRKEIPGEVNQKGYAIMAMSAITINGKTFRQQIADINRTL
jgi:hypothetical protein